jgi:hypothetical protein
MAENIKTKVTAEINNISQLFGASAVNKEIIMLT